VECAAVLPAGSVRAGQARRSARAWKSARCRPLSLEKRLFVQLSGAAESWPPAGAGPGALQRTGEAQARRSSQRPTAAMSPELPQPRPPHHRSPSQCLTAATRTAHVRSVGRMLSAKGFVRGRPLARLLRKIPSNPDQTVSFAVKPGHLSAWCWPRHPARPAGCRQYAQHFCDAASAADTGAGPVEADRCYYCFDAPCQTACPTGIDVPSFIQRIADGNLRGAAHAILSANPLGGMCARVCPTEVLCEQACVRNTNEDKPVEIGQLQRYATDAYFAKPRRAAVHARTPPASRVAVVGAGPAGMACAHGLARLGHDVVVFDANTKPRRPQRIRPGHLQDRGRLRAAGARLAAVDRRHRDPPRPAGARCQPSWALATDDAVFLGLGLAGVNALGMPSRPGRRARCGRLHRRTAPGGDPSTVPVGRRVVVIGGGMTAVDAAVQSKLLGAEQVHDGLPARPRHHVGLRPSRSGRRRKASAIRHWAAPLPEVLMRPGHVTGMRFAGTRVATASWSRPARPSRWPPTWCSRPSARLDRSLLA
jgi:dihydropyrimidine dehydrogenase (NAD+) subunit PreT